MSCLSNVELARLEQEIDHLQAAIPSIDTFVLPGGCINSAQSHVCRTVCRRGERRNHCVFDLEFIERIRSQTKT